MDLTADLGNTRLKLALWASPQDEEPSVLFETAPGELPGPEPPELWRPPFRRAFVSSVAGEEPTAELLQRLSDLAGEVRLAPDTGLENTTLTPETVGLDRLYAARAALEEAPRGAVVVDAGTALTVDAVGPGEAPFVGRFLGGAIAPGPWMGARALVEHTARLPEVEPSPGVPALGRDTPAALRAGLVVGFRGAARELVLEVAREAGLGEVPVFLTGGARRLLLEPAPVFTGADLRERPALVQRGLLLAGQGIAS